MNVPRRNYTIGRKPSCDISLADDTVSGHHAQLEFLENGMLLLTDCQSTNGTYLVGANGKAQRIQQSLVSSGDQVRFGNATLQMRDIINIIHKKNEKPSVVEDEESSQCITPEAPPPKGNIQSKLSPGNYKVLLAMILVVAVFFGYPILNEDASSVCNALEKKFVTLFSMRIATNDRDAVAHTFAGILLSELSNGQFASRYVKKIYPNTPPVLGCGTAYWKLVVNPSIVDRIAEDPALLRNNNRP